MHLFEDFLEKENQWVLAGTQQKVNGRLKKRSWKVEKKGKKRGKKKSVRGEKRRAVSL